MRQSTLRHGRSIGARCQRGVVLLIALIVLVAMTLAGLAMMRSIDTGTIVAGNIGFREAAVATGDSGIEAARTWLMANTATLNSDQPTAGYYSTRQDSLDITGNRTEGGLDGVDWGGSDPTQPVKAFTLGAVDTSGNTVYYIIHRLCSLPGSVNAAGQSCATVALSGTGSTQNTPDYSAYALAIQNLAYFRVTARVNGPKNTVSYVQAVLLM
ncbi:MAG: pilus assembly PilX family protein [Usitatibacter sp.]